MGITINIHDPNFNPGEEVFRGMLGSLAAKSFRDRHEHRNPEYYMQELLDFAYNEAVSKIKPFALRS